MSYNYNKSYWNDRYSKVGGKRTVGKRDWSEDQYSKFISQHSKVLKLCLEAYCKLGLILDFGCGVGRWVSLLNSVFDDYIGVDITEQAIIESQKTYPDKKFLHMSGDFNINICPQTIWTHVVLQHIIDDDLLQHNIAQFYNIIDDNGTVVITESHNDNKIFKNHYISHRSSDEYQSLFNNIGFETIYCKELIPQHHTIIFKKTRVIITHKTSLPLTEASITSYPTPNI